MPRVSVEVVHDMIRSGNDTVGELVELSDWPRVNIEGAIRQLGLVVSGDDKPIKRVTPAPPPLRSLPQHVVERDHSDDAGDRALDAELDRIHRDDEEQLERERSLPGSEPARPFATGGLVTSRHDARPGPLVHTPTPLEVLITKAAESPVAATRRLGERIDELCTDLTGRLRDEAAKALAKRQQEEAKAKAKADIERLERQLREARERAGLKVTKPKATMTSTTPAAPPAKPHAGASPSEIRAWALANGWKLGQSGRVPAEVKAAYETAIEQVAAS